MFILSSGFNIMWIFAWHYEYLAASVVLIFLHLISPIRIYLRLDIGRSKAKLAERLAVHLPFSVYLSWVAIATIADVSATLVSLNWDGFDIGPETWAVLIIMVALVIAILVAVTRRYVAYGLAIIWAFVGISVNQGSNQTIAMLMLVCAAVVVISLVMVFLYVRPRHMGRGPI